MGDLIFTIVAVVVLLTLATMVLPAAIGVSIEPSVVSACRFSFVSLLTACVFLVMPIKRYNFMIRHGPP